MAHISRPSADPNIRSLVRRVVFTGAAGLGAVGPVPLFTVTEGAIVRMIVAQAEEDLTDDGDGATLALGVIGSTSLFIGATDTDLIAAGLLWADTAPDNPGVALPAALKDVAVNNDIIATVGTEAVTGGVLHVRLYWSPLSAGSRVVVT